MVVVAGAEDAADADLVGADLALGGVVELLDVAVDLGLLDGRGVLGADGLQHDHKVALGLHAEVAAHGVFKRAVVGLLVQRLDGAQVRVGAPQQHVVEHPLLGARAGHGLLQHVHIVEQRAATQRHEAVLEPAAGLRPDVVDQHAPVQALVRRPDGLHLQRVLVRHHAHKRLLVRAKALHGLPQRVRVRRRVPVDGLRRAVADCRRRRRHACRVGRAVAARRGRRTGMWCSVPGSRWRLAIGWLLSVWWLLAVGGGGWRLLAVGSGGRRRLAVGRLAIGNTAWWRLAIGSTAWRRLLGVGAVLARRWRTIGLLRRRRTVRRLWGIGALLRRVLAWGRLLVVASALGRRWFCCTLATALALHRAGTRWGVKTALQGRTAAVRRVVGHVGPWIPVVG